MKHVDDRTSKPPKIKIKTYLTPVLLGCVWAGMLNSAAAQDQVSVSSCPGQATLPVAFQIDCSHLTDAATKQLCKPFINNQACEVFPAYRNITGINLEDTCKSIKFTIYEDSNWPHPKGEGGLALHCAVDYLAKYSLQAHPNSKIGPYDVHELLHEYQMALGALPDAHVLFASSMAEATRKIGETDEYERLMKNMKAEAPRLEQDLRSGKITGPKQCSIAETQVEESLYIANSRSVYAFYRKLATSKNPSQTDRVARFNRMFYLVSGPKPEVRKFLLDNGCSNF
jgi:hypothetical protein